MPTPIASLETSQKLELNDLITIPSQGITSKTLIERNGTKVVLFGMDRDQEISPHRSSFPATVYVWEGRICFNVENEAHELGPGDLLIMKKDAVHDLRAIETSRFMLTLLKQQEA